MLSTSCQPTYPCAGGGNGRPRSTVRRPPLDGAEAPTRRCGSPYSTVRQPPLDGSPPLGPVAEDPVPNLWHVLEVLHDVRLVVSQPLLAPRLEVAGTRGCTASVVQGV